MNFTLKHLRYFVASYEELSVKSAAMRLNISQPSVTAALAHLEGVFGVQLFIRHHAKGLTPTAAGRRLFGQANLLIKQAEGLHQYALDLGDSLTGELDIGCFVTIAPIYMPALIGDFQKRFPKIQVRCKEGNHQTLYQGLMRGDFELSLVYDIGPSDHLSLEPVLDLPPYAILPRSHKLARQKKVSLRALADEPMVLLDLPHSRQYFEKLFVQLGLEPNIVHRTPSPYMVRGLVANGLGYSLMNARTKIDQALDGRRFISRPIAGDHNPLTLCIARNAAVTLTRAAKTFAAYCKAHIPEIVASD